MVWTIKFPLLSRYLCISAFIYGQKYISIHTIIESLNWGILIRNLMRNQYEKEEALTGGNVSSVYCFWDTVRRELKPDSIKIHTLLKHLENKGLKRVPKFLGIDE